MIKRKGKVPCRVTMNESNHWDCRIRSQNGSSSPRHSCMGYVFIMWKRKERIVQKELAAHLFVLRPQLWNAERELLGTLRCIFVGLSNNLEQRCRSRTP